jgi:nickel-dependent lactate racemase
MLFFSQGSAEKSFQDDELRSSVFDILTKLGTRNRILVIPPDITRFHSMAGKITGYIWEYYKEKLIAILPALGTHKPMTCGERIVMYGEIPAELFFVHNWREDIITLGEVPQEFIEEVSEGRVHYSWPAQVNRLLNEGAFDLILSVGQVVPHEVIGMANYNKNIFIGTGGKEGINKSHYLAAAYGMERIMGRTDTPLRKVLNYASENLASHLPIVYIHTVVGRVSRRGGNGNIELRGVYAGDDVECFEHAARLSLQVNFEIVEKPLMKTVVYLDPQEYKSTWLGNKSIYRTRMAISNGGELIVLAPGLCEFGEDKEIDLLIRKYGYRNTPHILELVAANEDLRNNLSSAAHLIHGSTENRFTVTYCPGHLTKEEIESVGYQYSDLNSMMEKYNPKKMKEGKNILPGGEEIFYISNPALGLWSFSERFK